MDIEALRALAGQVLADATIAELPNHYRGKVRDNYDLADGSRVIIATDRISAFDRILATIPFKGEVLTQTARYWFEQTADICPNHVIAYPDPNVVVGRRLDILPVEIVVRDYLAGTTATSVLTLYQAGQREMYGVRLPDGLKANQRLPRPIITPTSKAFDGGHDEPLTPEAILAQGLLTESQWRTLSDYAFALFARGQQRAAERGLILVDTKYEFGTAPTAASCWPTRSTRRIRAATGARRVMPSASRGATSPKVSTRISCATGWWRAAIPTRIPSPRSPPT